MSSQGHERELPGLAGIGAFVTWCEELLALLSGPILTAGLALALIDLLTDGQLLARVPALLFVWAGSQAIGLDAQFIGAAAKLARAIRRRAFGPIVGYAVLCLALGYVGYLASNVFATQEANGLSTAEALARLGMNSTSWIVQRSALAVGLVFLSGFLRYVAPRQDAAASAEEEKAQLERDLALEPLRAQKRAMQARGLRSVAAAALGGKEDVPPQKPPTGGGTPQQTPVPVTPEATPETPPPNIFTLPSAPKRTRRKGNGRKAARASGRKGRANAPVLDKARAVWREGMTVAALEAASGISHGSAMKYHAMLKAEDTARREQASQAVQ